MTDIDHFVEMFLEAAQKALGDRARARVLPEWDLQSAAWRLVVVAEIGSGPMGLRHAVVYTQFNQEQADEAGNVLSNWVDSLDRVFIGRAKSARATTLRLNRTNIMHLPTNPPYEA